MMLDFFVTWVSAPNNALLFSGATFLLGTLIGHYLTLDLDKRKEFNELADPIRAHLRAELLDIRPGFELHDATASLGTLVDITYAWRRRGFHSAIACYHTARQEQIEYDEEYRSPTSYKQTAHVEAAITNLLRYLKRR